MTSKDTLEGIRTAIGDLKCEICYTYMCLKMGHKDNDGWCCFCIKNTGDSWVLLFETCDKCNVIMYDHMMKRKLKQWESWD